MHGRLWSLFLEPRTPVDEFSNEPETHVQGSIVFSPDYEMDTVRDEHTIKLLRGTMLKYINTQARSG